MPPIDGLREAEPWTNREATTAKQVPERLAILGGGVGRRGDGAGLAQRSAPQVTLVEARRPPARARGAVRRRAGERGAARARRGRAHRRQGDARCAREDGEVDGRARRRASRCAATSCWWRSAGAPQHDDLGLETVGARARQADRGRRPHARAGSRLAVRDRRRQRPRAAHPHGQVPGAHRRRHDPRPRTAPCHERRRRALAARDLHRPAGRGGRATRSTPAQQAGLERRARSTSRPRATPARASTAATTRPAPRGSWSTRTAGVHRRRDLHRPRGRRVPARRDDRGRRRGAARRALRTRCRRSRRAARSGSTCSRRSASPGLAAGRSGPRICAMDVVVAGGHGKIGLRLLRLLADGGHRARGLIRNPDHAAELDGGRRGGRWCATWRSSTTCPSAAPAPTRSCSPPAPGPGSGPERKRTVDYGAAVKLMEAGVRRYVMVSAISARPAGASGPTQMRPYYEAKARGRRAPDGERPRLHDRPPRRAHRRPGHRAGEVGTRPRARGDSPRRRGRRARSRCLETPSAMGKTFELVSGETPVDEAVRAL